MGTALIITAHGLIAAPLDAGANVRVQIAPLSLKALRDQNVVRQAQDYSCGAAALATLLTYGLNQVTSEREILDELFLQLSGDEARLKQKDGFSLLDMQRVAQARGLNAQGFRIKSQDLVNLAGPVIVFIEPQGYKHFAVFRGISGDRAVLADPSRGNIRMPVYQFLETWLADDDTGVIFVIERKNQQTKRAPSALELTQSPVTPPEILSARELLAVRAATNARAELHR